MAIKNLAEMGENLQKIVKRLLANQNLLKLLYYTNKDPLSQPDIDNKTIQSEIFEKLVKVVPKVDSFEDARAKIAVKVPRGRKNPQNSEFKDISVSVEVFVPITQWIIKSDNLRPYHIMGEIQKSLEGKTINGLGKINGGDFELNFITEEVTAFEMYFQITAYD